MTNPTADNTIVPLPTNQKITNPDGSPTLFFQRWAQERSIDISNGISMADLVAFLTVEPDPSGTYTAADITVDEYGRVIEASDGSAGASLTVTDGTTSVADVASLTFTGAAVTTTGAGDAVVTITGGGGGGGSAPTIVNVDYFRINSGTIVNTVNVPAPGNTQVIVQTAAGGTLGNNVAPPGFQNLFINTSGNVGNNPGQQYQGGSVFFRTADSGTTTAINFQASDWRNIAVFELENCTGVDAFFDYCNTNGNDFIIPVLRHSKGDLTFLMFEQDSGGTITFDALTGVTQLHQFIPSGTDNHAAAIAQLGSSAPSAVTGSNLGGFAYPCFLRVSAWNA